jgi:hypothetical protein
MSEIRTLFDDPPLAHDPGGKVRLRLRRDTTNAWAEISPCGRFRTLLGREWGDQVLGNYALWIGMNPSTADGDVDDPTIRREISFTDREGLKGYLKVNVMDYRATDPKRLLSMTPDERCSRHNYRTIREKAQAASFVVAAWGTLPMPLRPHAIAVEELLRIDGVRLLCLGTTKDGSPRHPLYVKGDAPLVPYPNDPALSEKTCRPETLEP